jgi:glutathione S-transferase
MATSGDLERAIADINGAVEEILAHCRETPDGPVLPTGPWGAKEVLAHLLFWHTFTYESVEGVLAGREPQPPRGQTDELNAQAAARYATTPIAKMADEFAAVHERLIAAMRKLPDPSVIVMRRPDGSQFNAPDRLKHVANHIRRHLDELRQSAA